MFDDFCIVHAETYGQMAASTRATTADPHGLIEMLFDAIDEQIAVAMGALETHETERRGKAVKKAVGLGVFHGGQSKHGGPRVIANDVR